MGTKGKSPSGEAFSPVLPSIWRVLQDHVQMHPNLTRLYSLLPEELPTPVLWELLPRPKGVLAAMFLRIVPLVIASYLGAELLTLSLITPRNCRLDQKDRESLVLNHIDSGTLRGRAKHSASKAPGDLGFPPCLTLIFWVLLQSLWDTTAYFLWTSRARLALIHFTCK